MLFGCTTYVIPLSVSFFPLSVRVTVLLITLTKLTKMPPKAIISILRM